MGDRRPLEILCVVGTTKITFYFFLADIRKCKQRRKTRFSVEKKSFAYFQGTLGSYHQQRVIQVTPSVAVSCRLFKFQVF